MKELEPKSTQTTVEPQGMLVGIEAYDKAFTLRPAPELRLPAALERAKALELSSESLLGRDTVLIVLQASGLPRVYMPPRVLYPPSTNEIYLQAYGNYNGVNLPADDVYVLVNNEQTLGYLQRSSLWSAITDVVATAQAYLSKETPLLVAGGVQPCFRREAQADIRPGWKELGFTQADIEIAALTSESQSKQDVDVLAIRKMVEFARAAGIPEEMIQIRINNASGILYSVLANLPFREAEQFGLQVVNEIAAGRVRGDMEKMINMQNRATDIIQGWLSEGSISSETGDFLSQLVNDGTYNETYLKAAGVLDVLSDLKMARDEVRAAFPKASIAVDPLSIRSGYDRTTMQLDVITPNAQFAEVGGGGAYELAAKRSWQLQFGEPAPQEFYMVGFAIGLVRLKTVKDQL